MMSFFLFLVLSFVTVAVVYLGALGLASLFVKIDDRQYGISSKRFAIIVPAHNEEEGLPATLSSLELLDYPKQLYSVFVVADNCSDETANVAKKYNVSCIIRNDLSKRGKGFALSFAFDRLVSECFDAFIVLDADNIISANYLQIMASNIEEGQNVIQSKNTVKNPLESALTWILAVGNAIENNLYCAGKTRLGLSAPLRGTGMCFSKDILVRFPWDANSLAEDAEYGLMLIENGERIYFSEKAEVLSDAPVNLAMLKAQRIRWASGNMQLTRRKALNLLLKGMKKRSVLLIDTAWSMLIRSKPLLLAMTLICFLISSILQECFFWSTLALFMWGAYFAAGIWSAGISPRSIRLTLFSPFYLVWLVGIALCGVVGFRGRQWVRTGRR